MSVIDLLQYERLEERARQRQTPAAVLSAAKLVVRSNAGDPQAKSVIRQVIDEAKLGTAEALQRLHELWDGRRFAQEALSTTVTGSVFGDIGKAFKGVAKTVEKWGPAVLTTVQGVVSLIPGIGTGISAAISTAEAVLSGGSPLDIAIHAAYGAIPIPPGIRSITDTVLDSVMALIKHPDNIGDAVLAAARDRVPAGLPRQIFDTLIHVVGKKIHLGTKPKAVAAAPAAQAAHAAGAAAPAGFTAADYYAELYTNGLPSALAKGLAPLSDEVHAHLSKLPDPRTTSYPSIQQIAPNLSLSPAHAGVVVANAQTLSGTALSPEQAAAATTAVASSAKTQSETDANLRVAQQMHTAPRQLPSPGNPGANLGIQATPNASRVVASPALAHLIPQIRPTAA